MAVEIRELIIKATISDDQTVRDDPKDQVSINSKEAIISECIEQVMQILKSKTER